MIEHWNKTKALIERVLLLLKDNELSTWPGKKWIGVDLDGTLAEFNGWKGPEHIGPPIPHVVDCVRYLMTKLNFDVRVFTSRAEVPEQVKPIRTWLIAQGLPADMPITCTKHRGLLALIDDRSIGVKFNTGVLR